MFFILKKLNFYGKILINNFIACYKIIELERGNFMNYNELKVGYCLVEDTDFFYSEGVILNIYNNRFDVLFFMYNKNKKSYEFLTIRGMSYKDISKYKIALYPHFCKIENIDKIFRKYLKQSDGSLSINHLKLLGICEINDMAIIAYFKPSDVMYLEIACVKTFSGSSSEFKESSCVYINESKNLNLLDISSNNKNTFYIPNNKDFLLPLSNKFMDLEDIVTGVYDMPKSISANITNLSVSGLSFLNRSKEYILSILETDNEAIAKMYPNGFLFKRECFKRTSSKLFVNEMSKMADYL